MTISTVPLRSRSVLRLLVALLLAASLPALQGSTPADAAENGVERAAGADRFGTAVEVSQLSYPGGAPVVFIATGRNFADALAVSPVAAGLGPVLLVEPNSLPDITREELLRLRPDDIVIVGGPAAVSDGVQLQLARLAKNTTSRIAGLDRYETAIEISQAFFESSAPTVYLAPGTRFANALAIAPTAAANKSPVLLTQPDVLRQDVRAEIERLSPGEIVIVGTESEVDEKIATDLRRIAPTFRVSAGTDPDLSAIVALSSFTSAPFALVATAEAFPDGLTGGALAGALPAPLFLVDDAGVADSVACAFVRLGVRDVLLLGGPAAVPTSVEQELREGFEFKAIPGCEPDIFEVAGAPLQDLIVSPDGTRAYVVNNRWNRLEVLDLVNLELLQPIAVGSNPVDVDIMPDGKTLYVTNSGGQDISVVDAAKGREVKRIRVFDQLGPDRTFLFTLGQDNSGDVTGFLAAGQADGESIDTFVFDPGTEELTPLDLGLTAASETKVSFAEWDLTFGPAEAVSGGFEIDVTVGDVTETVTDGDTIAATVGDEEKPSVRVVEVTATAVRLAVADDSVDPEDFLLDTQGVQRMVRSTDYSTVAFLIDGFLHLYDPDTRALTLNRRSPLANPSEADGGLSEVALGADGTRILLSNDEAAFVVDSRNRLEGTIRNLAGAGVVLTPDDQTAYRFSAEAGLLVADMDRFLLEQDCAVPLVQTLASPQDASQPDLVLNQMALAQTPSGTDVMVVVGAAGIELVQNPPTSESGCAAEPR